MSGDPLNRERLASLVLARRHRGRPAGPGSAGGPTGTRRRPRAVDPVKAARWEEHRRRLAKRLGSERLPAGSSVAAPVRRRRTGVEVLRVEDLAIHFGGVQALQGLSLAARGGQVTGVIGPNGAGKTTLFNCLGGLLTPDSGTVIFEGHRLTGTPRHRARLGLGRTFQTPRLFRSLTVGQNLVLGCEVADAAGRSYRFDPGLDHRPRPDRAERIARLVGYTGELDRPARSLPFGELRVVELARTLCAAPTLLLLDEPASGLDVEQAVTLVGLLRRLADLGLAVLLIEHDMSVVMGVCEAITVLEFGTVIARGTPEEIQSDQRVLDAYLGTAVNA
jgi:ABC-type branched-subunit amino acid transport system ATPase component